MCLHITYKLACYKNGFVTSFSVHKGNEHDSRTFKTLYDKMKEEINSYELEKIVADAGYKTLAIAKLLIDDNIEPFLPYKRPMTKKVNLYMMNILTVIYALIMKY